MEVVADAYRPYYLQDIFDFAVEAISFDKCSAAALKFLRCRSIIIVTVLHQLTVCTYTDAFIQLTVRARIAHTFEDSGRYESGASPNKLTRTY
jgi:hypothetical protein